MLSRDLALRHGLLCHLACSAATETAAEKLVMATVVEGFGKNKAAQWRGAAASWPLAGSLLLIYYTLDGLFFSLKDK